MPAPNRRTFLQASAALAASTAISPVANAFSTPAEPLFKISIAQWSLHNALFKKKMDNLDFAKTAKGMGIEAVEYVNQFFADKATDKKYIAEMKSRAEGEGVKSLLIMIDREGKLGDPNLVKRAKAVENHFKWVEAAKQLGCHSIRVNAGSGGSYEDQMHRAADGLHALSEFAGKHGLNVIVENHGGLSSNGRWLSSVIEKVGLKNCGTLPDFGNFRLGDGKTYNRYLGVMELMPHAKAVSAKSNDFDADGNEIHTDFTRMMKIVLDAGYNGYVGIEYEGRKMSEMDGIKATKVLLERVHERLSA